MKSISDCLEGIDKNTDQVLVETKCEKCGSETRVNSYDELWCKNCAMLVDACKCDLTKLTQNHVPTNLDSIQQLEVELKGNTSALNELKQLQLLFEYFDTRNKEKTRQLKEAYKELKKQKQLAEHLSKVGELCSGLTHNLRNPLGVISTTVQIIESTSKDSLNEKTLSRLSRITDATTNISNQIEDVLNFVRNKPLDLEIISLSKIFQCTINNVEIPERINVHLPENDASIECDHSKLEVVFMNLITNAIQAIEDKGDIFIRVNVDSDFITIDVENSGSEIPSHVLPKIFDSLFTTKASGTGLGLPFCKKTIEQHKGTISVSNNPTTFTIKLPTNDLTMIKLPVN